MSVGILYLHGFCSSPQSWKVRELARTLAVRGLSDRLFCPFLSHVPNEAIAQAEAIIGEHGGPLTVVGSSLGGFYATWLAEKHDLSAVLINPAVVAPISLEKYLGTQTNLHTHETFEFTREHIAQLRALEVSRVTPSRYLLMVETGDEVLDYRQAVARYAGCRQIVLPGGDHSFTRFPEHIAQLVEFCGL
ncbi:MAG: alpha/beta fold hydrolase [Candidatus Accumulibacter sp.]|nr:alpha/beta fold hydrolase [Accumulibacter sp.]